jgi:AbrB family looped-hinge helix DNA binding protein
MKKRHKACGQFYGAATIGERGQVMIPAEARRAMDLKKGEKLLVFGMGCDMITFSKLSKIEQFESHLSTQLDLIRSALKKQNRNKAISPHH